MRVDAGADDVEDGADAEDVWAVRAAVCWAMRASSLEISACISASD